jgi:hypothetical protein
MSSQIFNEDIVVNVMDEPVRISVSILSLCISFGRVIAVYVQTLVRFVRQYTTTVI